MSKCALTIVCFLAAALPWSGAALSQSEQSDAIAAAKELVVTTKADEHIKTLLPLIMQEMKPAIVQGRPEVERAFDAMMPLMLDVMNAQMAAFVEASAAIYARNFTVDEIRKITAFYRDPVGQKLLQRLPTIVQENLALGRNFGQEISKEMQDQMIEELRKRGHNI